MADLTMKPNEAMQKSPADIMNAIDAMLHNNATVPPELKTKWKQIRARFALYNTAYYDHFSYYLRSQAHQKLIYQIWYGLYVSAQLKARNASLAAQDMVNNTLELELARVEVKQLRRLGKDQELKRAEIKELADDMHDFSNRIEQTMRAENVSSEFTDDNDLYKYFRGYELYSINFTKHWRRLDAVDEILRIPRGAISLTNTLVDIFAHPAVASLLSNIVMAVPLFSLFVAGVGLLRDLWKAWAKNKSPFTRAMTTTIVVAGIIGVVISGLFPVAAAGIGCALVVVGVVQKGIIPWYQGRKAIAQKEEQIADNKDRLVALAARETTPIGASEKQALMRLIEDYCISDRCDFRISDIEKTRGNIQSGDFASLSQDSLIKAAINSNDEFYLHDFLIQGLKGQQTILDDRLKVMKTKQIERTILLVNSFVTLAAAILICIPTPPTVIAGVAINFATTIVSMAVKYQWVQKAVGFIKSIFAENKKPEVRKDESNENKPLLTPELSPNVEVTLHQSTKDMSTALTAEKVPHAVAEIDAAVAKYTPSASVSLPSWLGFHTNGKHPTKQETEKEAPLKVKQEELKPTPSWLGFHSMEKPVVKKDEEQEVKPKPDNTRQ